MKTMLKIEGMTCEGCVRNVREALMGVPGVQAASVDLKGAAASVEHEPSVSAQRLAEAVESRGFDAMVTG